MTSSNALDGAGSWRRAQHRFAPSSQYRDCGHDALDRITYRSMKFGSTFDPTACATPERRDPSSQQVLVHGREASDFSIEKLS